MLEKAKYDEIAQKLERDLNERLPRIHWKVGNYNEQLLRAIESRDWWAENKSYEGIAIAPKEAFESAMSIFHIDFFVRIEGEKLIGETEVDCRVVNLFDGDPVKDAVTIIGEMTSHEIANMLIIE